MHTQKADASHSSSTHPPAAPPLPTTRPHNAPKRRTAQRVFLKDRPEAICQLQINEINKLSQQLAAYKHQYKAPISIHSDHDPQRMKGHSSYSRPADVDQTLKNIITAGENYRCELLAAQERRAQEARQGAAIQRHIDAFSRQREAISAEVANQKSKNSILEQELFMIKDAFQKHKSKTDTERHQHLQEIKSLRVNCNGLELLVKDLSVKAGLIPMYEQRINEGQYKFGVLSQQLMQVRGQLRYYQQKSTYFESNYNVLNENFNNLYNTNLKTTNELKETKTAYAKLQTIQKILQEECKVLTAKCFDLSEEKHKLTGQLNNEIATLSERIKGEVKSSDRTEKANEQLTSSLDQAKRVTRDLQTKNTHLEKEIQSKNTIIHGLKATNDQLQSSLKELQESLAKKEELWKNTIANQIMRLSNESHEKALSISTQLVKSQENAKNLSIGLAKSEQQLELLKEKVLSLQKHLNTLHIQLKQKENTHNAQKEHYQRAKIEIFTLQNSIKQYESRLSTAMSVQEQINSSSKATNQEKNAKIKDLQAKVQQLNAQNLRLKLNGKDLLEEISKLTEISTMLRGELEISQQEAYNLEEQFSNEGKKSAWLGEQNRIKEEIIAKYNSVAEEMRAKITSYYNEITELTDRNAMLEDETAQTKHQIQLKQAEITEKAKIIQETTSKLQENIQQAQKMKAIIAGLFIEKAQLTKKHEEISEEGVLLIQKLSQSQNSFSQLHTAFKETVEQLLMKHELQAEKLKYQHKTAIEQIETTSQQEKQQKSQNIEALKQEITSLSASLEESKKSIRKLQAKIKDQSTQIESLQKKKAELTSQSTSKAGEIELLLKQREQMAHLVELKTDNIQKLKVSLIQLDETYRNSIQEGAKKHQESKSVILCQWNDERQALSLKVQEGVSHLQRKIELEQELKNVNTTSQNFKLRLQNEQIRVQNLAFQNELLRKAIKELQATFTSQLERELSLKFKFQQEEFDRLHAEIDRISKQKLTLSAQNGQTSKRLLQLAGKTELLLDQNNRLQLLLKQNMQTNKEQVQFLKKANIQLQIHLQSALQSSQSDSKTKSDLSQSLTTLQARNAYLEQYMNRTKTEIACMIPIFKELKEERDLLIQKYIVLSNEVCKLNHKDESLNRELSSFGEYFTRVAALHNQINKHLFNITHQTQGIIVRFVQPTASQLVSSSKMHESIVEKLEN